MAITTENANSIIDSRGKTMPSMVRVLIMRGTIIAGKGHVDPGTVHTVDAKAAAALFGAQKAVPAPAPAEKPIVQAAEPTTRAAKPKPKAKPRAKKKAPRKK